MARASSRKTLSASTANANNSTSSNSKRKSVPRTRTSARRTSKSRTSRTSVSGSGSGFKSAQRKSANVASARGSKISTPSPAPTAPTDDTPSRKMRSVPPSFGFPRFSLQSSFRRLTSLKKRDGLKIFILIAWLLFLADIVFNNADFLLAALAFNQAVLKSQGVVLPGFAFGLRGTQALSAPTWVYAVAIVIITLLLVVGLFNVLFKRYKAWKSRKQETKKLRDGVESQPAGAGGKNTGEKGSRYFGGLKKVPAKKKLATLADE